MTGRIDSETFESGYTLIEVLMAIAIFSIGLMAMGALQSGALLQTGDITRKTEAWTILEEEVNILKAMPFYANDDGIDNDGDGTIDELTEEMPELMTGARNALRADGRYMVHWQVDDDEPIAAVTIPPTNPGDPLLPGLAAGTYTVSKTITVAVTRPGENPQTGEVLATAQFVKVWAGDVGGIP
jgi:prepilin-type N-terminal cleavage/methylation domain-containing protein